MERGRAPSSPHVLDPFFWDISLHVFSNVTRETMEEESSILSVWTSTTPIAFSWGKTLETRHPQLPLEPRQEEGQAPASFFEPPNHQGLLGGMWGWALGGGG